MINSRSTKRSGYSALVGAINPAVTVCENAPVYPKIGDLWVKSTTNIIKRYNGSSWVLVSGIVVSTIAPTSPTVGDLWYDIS